MKLRFSVPFDSNAELPAVLDSLPPQPAVFVLHPHAAAASPSPYLARTQDLHRRLARLLSRPQKTSRMLNLREFTARIEYQPVGSSFEAQWLLYLLNRHYYPRQYRERLRLRPPALLKLNLSNRFPRCYPTRRLSEDGALYYGPYPTQVAAERFASEFLDFFKIRRCVEELDPDPAHPGCIYSQLKMCLAPCFAGCTDDEYQQEVQRVVEFLDAQGRPLLRSLEAERTEASEALEFEQAAKIHRRIEKVNEVLRQKSELVRNLCDLHAVVVQRGAEPKSINFFRVCGGEIRGPAALALDENVPTPIPLDKQLHGLLDSLLPHAVGAAPERPPGADSMPQSSAEPLRLRGHPASLPPWDHLSLLARWYYSSFREGELVMLNPGQDIPHTRLIRICRKLLTDDAERAPQ
jgi:excinuclease ABC subunit C